MTPKEVNQPDESENQMHAGVAAVLEGRGREGGYQFGNYTRKRVHKRRSS